MQGLRAWRSVLAIGGLMAFLAIVAVAAAGHAPSAGASRPSTPAPRLLQDYVATLAILIMPIGIVLIVWAMVMPPGLQGRPAQDVEGVPDRRRPAARTSRSRSSSPRSRSPSASSIPSRPRRRFAAAETHRDGRRRPTDQGDEYEPQFRWLPMIVVGSLIVGIGGAMAMLAARRQRELLAATPIRETLAEVLDETLDDLRREDDPRKAVIGAYANMERTLAARGVPRRESEAPAEYLDADPRRGQRKRPLGTAPDRALLAGAVQPARDRRAR